MAKVAQYRRRRSPWLGVVCTRVYVCVCCVLCAVRSAEETHLIWVGFPRRRPPQPCWLSMAVIVSVTAAVRHVTRLRQPLDRDGLPVSSTQPCSREVTTGSLVIRPSRVFSVHNDRDSQTFGALPNETRCTEVLSNPVIHIHIYMKNQGVVSCIHTYTQNAKYSRFLKYVDT